MTHNFNSVSVISGQWEGDNEKLSATEPCLQQKKRFPFPVGLQPGTARSAGQSLSYRKNSKIWDTSNNCHNCPKIGKV